MKILILATLLLLTMTDPYPDFSHKTLPEIKENESWEIIAEARGYLDLDSNEDLVIILQSKNIVSEKRCEDCEIKNCKARIIVVLMNSLSKSQLKTICLLLEKMRAELRKI